MDEGEGDEERALAATKLQARIRGNEARKSAAAETVKMGDAERERVDAAVVMQRRARGSAARSQTTKALEQAQVQRARAAAELAAMQDKQQAQAAVTVQKHARGHMSAKQVNEAKRRAREDLTKKLGKEQEAAALTVQRHTRGANARARMAQAEQKAAAATVRAAETVVHKAEAGDSATLSSMLAPSDEEQTLAATKLQARIRGNEARKQMGADRARANAPLVRGATISRGGGVSAGSLAASTTSRRNAAGKRPKEYTQDSAATMIQAHLRGRAVRRATDGSRGGEGEDAQVTGVEAVEAVKGAPAVSAEAEAKEASAGEAVAGEAAAPAPLVHVTPESEQADYAPESAEQAAAAAAIQRRVRGRASRDQVAKSRAAAKEAAEKSAGASAAAARAVEQEAAALTMQRTMRGKASRDKAAKASASAAKAKERAAKLADKAAAAEVEAREMEMAASGNAAEEQAATRGAQAHAHDGANADQAALLLQRRQRGNAARKDLQSRRQQRASATGGAAGDAAGQVRPARATFEVTVNDDGSVKVEVNADLKEEAAAAAIQNRQRGKNSGSEMASACSGGATGAMEVGGQAASDGGGGSGGGGGGNGSGEGGSRDSGGGEGDDAGAAAEREQAAIRMQAAMRGRATRSKAKRTKTARQVTAERAHMAAETQRLELVDEQRRAAIIVQKRQRGLTARNSNIRKKNAKATAKAKAKADESASPGLRLPPPSNEALRLDSPQPEELPAAFLPLAAMTHYIPKIAAPPLPLLPPLPEPWMRRRGSIPSMPSRAPSPERPPSPEDLIHTSLTQHMTAFTLNRQLPWNLYTIMSGRRAETARASTASAFMPTGSEQPPAPSSASQFGQMPIGATTSKGSQISSMSMGSSRSRHGGRRHHPRDADRATLGQSSSKGSLSARADLGSFAAEPEPPATSLERLIPLYESDGGDALLDALHLYPAPRLPRDGTRIGGVGSTRAPNAVYARTPHHVMPLRDTLAPGLTLRDMHRLRTAPAADSTRPTLAEELATRAEKAVARSVLTPPMLSPTPPPHPPPGGYGSGPAYARSKFQWRPTIQAPPRALHAMHPVREISPRLAGQIAQTSALVKRRNRRRTPAAVELGGAAEELQYAYAPVNAPMLPRIAPLAATM